MSSKIKCHSCGADFELGTLFDFGNFGYCTMCHFRKLQKFSCVPERYENARLSDFSDETKVRLKNSFEKGSYIYGGFGVGKTYAFYSIVNNYIWEKHEALTNVYKFGDVVRKFRNFNEPEFFDKVSRCRFLFIDDLGDDSGDNTGFVKMAFNDLIDKRYSENLKTIITSNFDLNGLTEKFSQKTSERIFETFEVIEMSGKNWRVKND